ncbi:MAG: PDZ domain-containing protein, partial [Oscillospiraceae bacterium]|nr:PDZ domain-containing protein [Oscillospiraceae bacterium]
MPVRIKSVSPGSPADKAGIKAGARLVSVNGFEIGDVLDYMFYADAD